MGSAKDKDKPRPEVSQVSELQLVWNILFRVGLGPGVGPGPVLTSHKSRGDLQHFS